MPSLASCTRPIDPAKRRLKIVAGLLVLALGAPAAADRIPSIACPADLLLADLATLQRAIACAPAQTTLRLAPGASLGVLEIKGLRHPGLTIASADPARPARFGGISIQSSSGIVLRRLRVEGPVPKQWRQSIVIRTSNTITLEGLELHGPAPAAQIDTAVLVQDSDTIRLRRLIAAGYRNGLTLMNSRKVVLSENALYGLSNDGIRGAGVEDVLIERNLMGNFTPDPGNHADGIQFWSRNQQAASQDITIRHNLVIRGRGQPIQGIFIRDSAKLPFHRLTIEGNAVIGGNFQGILVDGADGVSIRQNVVLPLDQQLSWVQIKAATNAVASDNRAGKFLLHGESKGMDNTVITIRRDYTKELQGWLAKHKLSRENFPVSELQDVI